MRKKEWKSQTERKHSQDRNEDRMRWRHRWGAGRDSKRKKKEAKALALSWQFLSHGREDVSSHAPVVRLKNLGLLHSIQQSNSTHGCLVGRELVIPPSLHLPAPVLSTSLFFHTTSICILFASITPRVSWPPCNKETSSAFLFFLQNTGEHKRHSQQHGWRLRQAKRPDAENQMQSCQAESGAPTVPGPSCWWRRWGPNLEKRKWTVIV